jgi:hypothetical protein
VVTKVLVNRIPFSASLSTVGVFMIGCPATESISFLWSSTKKNKMFGFFPSTGSTVLQHIKQVYKMQRPTPNFKLFLKYF